MAVLIYCSLMQKLLQGILKFRNAIRTRDREMFAGLAERQSPEALLITCSDSRVMPCLFTSAEPGDLFVVRNVGNLVAPCGPDGCSVGDKSEAAAVEYATLALGVSNIIICGHSNCGAMRALADGKQDLPFPHLDEWLTHSQEALTQIRAGTRMNDALPVYDSLSQLNVLHQLRNLRTYPHIRDHVAAGRLRLSAWWFDIARADVLTYDEQLGRFVVIDEDVVERLLATD